MSTQLAGIKACQDLKTLLSANWNASNTDSKTPDYAYQWELKWQQKIKSADLIIFNYTETAKASLYALDWTHWIAVSIECFTVGFTSPHGSTQLSHVTNMGNEVARILKANPRLAGYAMQYINASRLQPHDDMIAYSLFLDVNLIKVNPRAE